MKQELQNLDDLKIRKAKKILTRTEDFINSLNVVIERQSRVNNDIVERMELGEKKLVQLKSEIDTLRSMSTDQRNVMKKLVFEDSSSSLLIGILFSYPIGFLSSFFAAYVHNKLRPEKI